MVRYDLLFIPFYDYCNVCNRVVERGKEVKVVFAQASAEPQERRGDYRDLEKHKAKVEARLKKLRGE